MERRRRSRAPPSSSSLCRVLRKVVRDPHALVRCRRRDSSTVELLAPTNRLAPRNAKNANLVLAIRSDRPSVSALKRPSGSSSSMLSRRARTCKWMTPRLWNSATFTYESRARDCAVHVDVSADETREVAHCVDRRPPPQLGHLSVEQDGALVVVAVKAESVLRAPGRGRCDEQGMRPADRARSASGRGPRMGRRLRGSDGRNRMTARSAWRRPSGDRRPCSAPPSRRVDQHGRAAERRPCRPLRTTGNVSLVGCRRV